MNPSVRARIIVVVLVLSVATGGCAALKAYPDRSIDPVAEIKALAPYLAPDVLAKYHAASDTERNGLTQRQWRDAVIEARIREADIQFNAFQQKLFEQGVGFGIATDWIVLALNAAGALSGGAANVLAATSGGVVGARASFEKNAFFDRTMPSLLATMVAGRKETLVKIRQAQTGTPAEYSLGAALNDLETYYNAGSIPAALTQIAETSGAAAKKADAELKSLGVVVAVSDVLQKRRAAAATYVKSLTPAERATLAKSLGITGPADPVAEVLGAIATADTEAKFDRIAQTINVLFGRDF